MEFLSPALVLKMKMILSEHEETEWQICSLQL